MKRILFDLLSAQPSRNSQFHGGGEYIKTVFKYMVENYSDKVSVTVFYDENNFIDDYIIEIIKKYNVNVIYINSIEEIDKCTDLAEYDIFYSGIPYAHNYKKVNFPNTIKRIGTFHGFRFLEKYTDINEKFYYDGYKVIKPILKRILYRFLIKKPYDNYKKSIDIFDKVICDSNHTRYALSNFFPEFNKEIKMLYVPAKFISLDNNVDDSEVKSIGKYILLIGMNRWEKNAYRAISVLENLYNKKLLNGYKIVTVGKIPAKIEKKIKHKENYIKYGYVETQKLEALYKNCDIFFYPTLNEGFGMPPLEAMKYGKTCVISSVCSLPEIYGDCVYYVNPYDINEMSSRILNAVYEKKDYNAVIEYQKKISYKQEQDLKKICETIIF